MSRLDSMLRRLSAQRDGLNWAVAQVENVPGDVLEIGLGNGRSYDHLRTHAAGRRIWVIDRILQCHPDCVPPAEDFLQGEARDMLARLQATNTKVALAHYDLGRGVDDADRAEARALSDAISALIVPGGLIVSGQPLEGLTPVPGPEGIPEGRYMFYRKI